MAIDADLLQMNESQLRAEAQKLRDAIRAQRDQNGHDLCWYVPELWDSLPEKLQPQPAIPEWSEFIQKCAAFRKSLDDKT